MHWANFESACARSVAEEWLSVYWVFIEVRLAYLGLGPSNMILYVSMEFDVQHFACDSSVAEDSCPFI